MDEYKKISLDVILRTHDGINIHPNARERYCKADKRTLIKKCVKSLVNACNDYDGNIRIIWLDDHSSEETIQDLHKIFSEFKHETIFIPLENKGWNASGYAQFDKGRESNADLVYFVEDDYLHYPTAIEEMIDAYLLFKKNTGREIAIHPFDDPDNYKPLYILPSRIVLGKNRHWRTNEYTTFSFMCNPEVVRKHWSSFYTLATEYMTEWGEKNNVHEGTTINKIWREDVLLFTPIPSVALHMQYEEQKDAYLDWTQLWNSII